MLSKDLGKFTIILPTSVEPQTRYKEGILIGRLDTCDIILDHSTVSRIHAGINFRDQKYVLVNLSSTNVLTINGRLLAPQKSDVLADGDTIQIGPFTIAAAISDEGLISLAVQQQQVAESPVVRTPTEEHTKEPHGDVLKVFWEKRTREKEDWGTRLRPTEKPVPGKAMFNWRPTRDLRRPWRTGLFIWAFLLITAVGVFAYFRYPTAYEPDPLSNPHASKIEGSQIAASANANSCTTCHAPNEPMENACVRCHQAEQFHATNTKAHEDAGITCTVCHKEHQGANFDMNATAIQSCAQCHNDNNKENYNGKTVRTAHGGSYGYPADSNAKWTWKGVYREVADAIPEINSSATGDADEQQRLSRQFHSIHVGRLKAPDGLKGDKRGLVSCSTCHTGGLDPVDRVGPKQTCAACHTNQSGQNRDQRFASSSVNCISCHTQHPYSGDRWNEFLTDDATRRRKEAIAAKFAPKQEQ